MAASLGSLIRRFNYRAEFDPKTGVNKRLLKKVEDHLLKHPETYDQTVFCMHHEDEIDQVSEVTELRSGPMCGTQACVAGWTVLYSGAFKESVWSRNFIDWEDTARTALGLDEKLARWLFDASRSPRKMPYVLRAIRKGTLHIPELSKIEKTPLKKLEA